MTLIASTFEIVWRSVLNGEQIFHRLVSLISRETLEPIDWAEVQRIEKIEEENYNSIMEQMKLGSKVFKFIDDTKQEYIATGDYNTWWVLGLDESVTLKGLIDLEKEQPAIKWAYKALSNIGHYIPNNVLREWVNLMEGKEITRILQKLILNIVK